MGRPGKDVEIDSKAVIAVTSLRPKPRLSRIGAIAVGEETTEARRTQREKKNSLDESDH
jgi:hypothetical protein